jgi:multicomponent Na+:H+ antiporter subunit B
LKALGDSVLGIAFISILTLVLVYAFSFYPEVGFIRPLGEFYLYNTFNVENQTFWSGSPNAVTGLLWDYRGYDTLYETMVFYVGIVAVSLFFERKAGLKESDGMTVIVRSTAKIVFIFILTSAFAITIFSIKTPGGGFQGGSIMAIAFVALLVALSRGFLPRLNVNVRTAHLMKILGISFIAALTILPVAFSLATGSTAYALQNQPKPWSEFGYPPFLVLQGLSGGMIIPIQIGEMLHVGMGFTVIFLLLTLKEDDES